MALTEMVCDNEEWLQYITHKNIMVNVFKYYHHYIPRIRYVGKQKQAYEQGKLYAKQSYEKAKQSSAQYVQQITSNNSNLKNSQGGLSL